MKFNTQVTVWFLRALFVIWFILSVYFLTQIATNRQNAGILLIPALAAFAGPFVSVFVVGLGSNKAFFLLLIEVALFTSIVVGALLINNRPLRIALSIFAALLWFSFGLYEVLKLE